MSNTVIYAGVSFLDSSNLDQLLHDPHSSKILDDKEEMCGRFAYYTPGPTVSPILSSRVLQDSHYQQCLIVSLNSSESFKIPTPPLEDHQAANHACSFYTTPSCLQSRQCFSKIPNHEISNQLLQSRPCSSQFSNCSSKIITLPRSQNSANLSLQASSS